MSLSYQPVPSFGPWGAAAAGAVFAVSGLLIGGAISDAALLSFDTEPPNSLGWFLAMLPVVAMGIGGWAAQALVNNTRSSIAIGGMVWGSVALALLALVAAGIDVAGSDELLGPGFAPDDADLLRPLVRGDAWRSLGLECGTFLAAIAGAWIHRHDWSSLSSLLRRASSRDANRFRRRAMVGRTVSAGLGNHAGHPL